MTNKEAAVILKLYKQRLDESCSNLLDRDKEALELAIKSLEGRPTGEWIFNRKNPQTGANIFRCSLCNYESQVFTCGIKYPAFDKFCGYCGADMRKGGEEK